mmetsp:Transcript_18148/g.59594  ORF Transcript_18148/g.59594 Transcript_18148/m.59594 type:complete len:235 (-) Transcript_18148:466-1170(-)
MSRQKQNANSCLMALNVFIVFPGAILTCLGWYVMQAGGRAGITSDAMMLPGAVIASGIFLLLLGLVGISAIRVERPECLSCYFVMLVVDLTALITLMAFCLFFTKELNVVMCDEWKKQPEVILRQIESEFECCGCEGGVNSTMTSNATCGDRNPSTQSRGCRDVISTFLRGRYVAIGALCLVFSVVQITAVYTTVNLIKKAKSRMHRELEQDRFDREALLGSYAYAGMRGFPSL